MSGILRLLAKEADAVKAWRETTAAALRAEEALLVEMIGSTNIAIGERRGIWGAVLDADSFVTLRTRDETPLLGVLAYVGGISMVFPFDIWLTMEGPL